MSTCNGNCKSCCSLNSLPGFESLTTHRREAVMSLLRNNASSVNNITDSAISAMAEQDLQRCLSQIRHYEKEKRRLDGLLMFLENQKTALERVKDDCKSLGAPIRRIPREVLRNIFVLLEGKSQFGHVISVEGFQVAAVCRHWRTVALSTRSLWSDIIIQDSIPEDAQQLLVGLDRIFQLSGSHPLRVLVECDSASDNSELADRLLQQSHRWKHATFVDDYDLFFPATSLSLPIIETLGIHIDSILGRAVLWPPTPNLRTLTIHGGTISYETWSTLPNLVIPTHDLGVTVSHLVLSNIPLNMMLQFITRCPSLISLEIREIPVTTLENTPLTACNSTITALSTVGCYYPFIKALFEQLHCPKLTSVDVDQVGTPNDSSFPHFAFLSMLERSSAKLHSLTLKGFMISGSTMVKLLERIPTITTLTLHVTMYIFAEVPTSLLSRMDANREFARLLSPNLKELTLLIQPHGLMRIQTRPFVDMIRSRWVPANASTSDLPVSGLKHVHATFEFELDDAELAPLKVLKGAGMDLVLADSRGSISLDSMIDDEDRL
ncbi:hypothetical protein C8J56DRAFT_922089 [Mycena floridula]|nr:hypothetical protein C8J56DRAFT_922089 [Mycena floridula]